MINSRIITTFFSLLFVCLLSAQTEYKKNGRNVIKDEQGNVSVGRTKNYLREGKWYESYPDHTKKSFGKYHLGLAEGRHIMYWPNGRISSIRDYNRGKHHGHWIEFNEHGDTTEHRTFNMDVLHGYCFMSMPAVGKKAYGNYVNGKQSGWWVGSGLQTDSVEMVNGVRNGKQIIRDTSGYYSVGYFKNGEKDSVYREYVNGKLHYECWYHTGAKYKYEHVYFPEDGSVRSELRYVGNSEVEVYFEFQSPKILGKVEWYSHNHLDSILEYYPNGKIQNRYVYRAREFGFHQVVREYIGYDSTGQNTYVHYCDAKGKDSIRRDYSATGSLLRELHYVNGAIRGQKYFYADGTPMLLFSNEEIKVFSDAGKQLKPGSAAYSNVFNKFDSLESEWTDRLLFPPIVSGYEVASDLLAIDLESPVTYADEEPIFPGGSDSLKVYLSKHIVYPQFDKENGNEGTVYVQFVVEKNGMVNKVQLQKGVQGAPGLGKEAVRVVSAMPKWSPGYLKGVPVRYQMTLPVAFRLNP